MRHNYTAADFRMLLDTLPCNAHTTASDALWAGLPVLTCQGQSFAARVAASLLQAAGLPDMVVHDLDQYEALALRLARTQTLLHAIRERLRINRDSCALFDSDRYRRNIERAYTTMWEIASGASRPEAFAWIPIELRVAHCEARASREIILQMMVAEGIEDDDAA